MWAMASLLPVRSMAIVVLPIPRSFGSSSMARRGWSWPRAPTSPGPAGPARRRCSRRRAGPAGRRSASWRRRRRRGRPCRRPGRGGADPHTRCPRCGTSVPARGRSAPRSAGRWPWLQPRSSSVVRPIRITEPDSTGTAPVILTPPTWVPLLEPWSSTNQPSAPREDPRVPARGELVVEDERALGAAADEHALAAERERGAGHLAVGDDEGDRVAPTSRRTRRRLRSRTPRHRPPPQRERGPGPGSVATPGGRASRDARCGSRRCRDAAQRPR